MTLKREVNGEIFFRTPEPARCVWVTNALKKTTREV